MRTNATATRFGRCEWDWELESPLPPNGRAILPDWLREARALRARELYLGPESGNPGWEDADALDADSYHILARSRGRIIGCVRMTAAAGRERGQAFFAGLGFRDAQSWPDWLFSGPLASRWVVARDHRCLGLALRLVAGAYGLARRSGWESVYAAVGTRSGQDRLLLRSGAIPATEFGGRVNAAHMGQEAYMMRMDIYSPRATFAGMIMDMDQRLGLYALGSRRAA